MQTISKTRVTLAATMLLACCSCGSPGGSDCAVAVRFEGNVYVEAAFTEDTTTATGSGELAACADGGPGASGLDFKAAKTVPLEALKGYPASEVVVLREDGYARVLVAEKTSDQRRDQIVAAVGE